MERRARRRIGGATELGKLEHEQQRLRADLERQRDAEKAAWLEGGAVQAELRGVLGGAA